MHSVKGTVSCCHAIWGMSAFRAACACTQTPSRTRAGARFLSAPSPVHQSDYYKGHIRRENLPVREIALDVMPKGIFSAGK